VFLYALRRILYALPIAISVSLVCFLLVKIAPGDAISAIAPADAPAEVVEQLRKDYGLDKPVIAQFAIWLRHVAAGDLGRSIATGRPVWNDLSVALKYTLLLAFAASFVGFVLGCLLGGVAATFRDTWVDRSVMPVAIAGVSVPHYWFGMLLVVAFSVSFNLLPPSGGGPEDIPLWEWARFKYLVLPAVALSAIPMGIVARSVRGSVIEILNQDYITTLRGKGLRTPQIAVHVIKNAAPAVIAVMGLQLGYLMGGSILVETVFSWPGTGFLLNSAIFQRDIPVLQGTILVLSLFFVALNLIVDLAQTLLDPRIKRQ
jgi:peptide/nickel transport system permease protein